MSASNILLLNPINATLMKEVPKFDDSSMAYPRRQSSCKSNSASTTSSLHSMPTRRLHLLSQPMDPLIRNRQIDRDNNGMMLYPAIVPPASQDHCCFDSTPDSQTGMKTGATGGGETVPKIRSEFKTCGPLMTLVHVLRDSWNDTNLAGITPHHKNHTDSHKTNSKEESHQKMATTMTARPLPTEYLPSRRMNLSSVPRGHYTSRNNRIRSRSIAIKRPSSEEQLEEIRQNSLAAEYDWATWRMYNRIIEYRKKHPLPYVHEDHAESFDATSVNLTNTDGPDSSSDCTIIDNENQLIQDEILQQHYPEYGEVFDLDL